MPTGYTDAIKDGITFEQFALQCARAFGALITMRDEPQDAAIPDSFAPSDYHVKAMEAARLELVRIEAMPARAAERSADAAYEEAEAARLRRIAERNDLRGKYEAMLSRVQAWNPPTEDHVGMRKFMADQITESIRFDCSTDYDSKPTVRMSGPQWRAEQVTKARRDIAYHGEQFSADLQRAASRTAWVQALRDSLK